MQWHVKKQQQQGLSSPVVWLKSIWCTCPPGRPVRLFLYFLFAFIRVTFVLCCQWRPGLGTGVSSSAAEALVGKPTGQYPRLCLNAQITTREGPTPMADNARQEVLLGPRRPTWSCAVCGTDGNWASRIKCRAEGCNRAAPSRIARDAHENHKKELAKRADGKSKSGGAKGGAKAGGGAQTAEAQELRDLRAEVSRLRAGQAQRQATAGGAAAAASLSGDGGAADAADDMHDASPKPEDITPDIEKLEDRERRLLGMPQDEWRQEQIEACRAQLRDLRERRRQLQPVEKQRRLADRNITTMEGKIANSSAKEAELAQQLSELQEEVRTHAGSHRELQAELQNLRLARARLGEAQVAPTPQCGGGTSVPADQRGDALGLVRALEATLGASDTTSALLAPVLQAVQYQASHAGACAPAGPSLLAIAPGAVPPAEEALRALGDDEEVAAAAAVCLARLQAIRAGAQVAAASAAGVESSAPVVGHRPPGTAGVLATLAMDAEEAREMPVHADRYSPY